MVASGFSMAVNAFIGQNFGAGKMSRVIAGYRTATILMLVWGLICTLLLIVFPEFIFQIFIREAEVLPMGVSYLRILGVCQLLIDIRIATGVFNGLGETRIPSAVSVVSNVLRVPLALLLSATPLKLDGIWWAVTLTCMARGLIITIWNLLYIRKHKVYEHENRSAKDPDLAAES